MAEYNVRSTVFLKRRTNWDSVLSAVRRFTSCKSADILVVFDQAIGEVICRYAPTTILRSNTFY